QWLDDRNGSIIAQSKQYRTATSRARSNGRKTNDSTLVRRNLARARGLDRAGRGGRVPHADELGQDQPGGAAAGRGLRQERGGGEQRQHQARVERAGDGAAVRAAAAGGRGRV